MNINREQRDITALYNEDDSSNIDVCLQLNIKLSRKAKIPVITPHFVHFRNTLIHNALYQLRTSTPLAAFVTI
jgi:hypothetical protein